MMPLEFDEENNENVVVEFDLSNAMTRVGITDVSCRTPQASPCKRHHQPSQHLMNGSSFPSYGFCASNIGDISSNADDSTALFDLLTPTTVSSGSCSGFGASSSASCPSSIDSSQLIDLDASDEVAGNTYCRIDTIHEGVEVTLMKATIAEEKSHSFADDLVEYDDDDLNTINSSILGNSTPNKNCNSKEVTSKGLTTPETPAGVAPLCGWLCAAADTEKHICESLGVDHLVCWQSTVPSSGKSSVRHRTNQRRSKRSHQQLQNIRRNLQFHQPIQQSASFNIAPSVYIPTPTKPSCLPGVCTRRERTPTKTDSADEGYGSDPENYVTTARSVISIAPRQVPAFRAKTIDELFNERIPCLRHTETCTTEVTLFLERGHVRYANSAPRLCCATVDHRLEEIGLLEVSKVLCPSTADFLLAADPNRCLMVRSCQGLSWTLEIASPGVAEEVADLLKLAVATLAAAVLTEQTLDRLYFDG